MARFYKIAKLVLTSFFIQWSGTGYLYLRDDKTFIGEDDDGYQIYSVSPNNIQLWQALVGNTCLEWINIDINYRLAQ